MEKNQSKLFSHAEQRGLRHCEETEVSVIARKQRSPSLRENRGLRHCEERSDEAIHMTVVCPKTWIASLRSQ